MKKIAKVTIVPNPRQKKAASGSTIMIRVETGKVYADALNKLPREVNPDVNHMQVVGARPRRMGDLLIKIGRIQQGGIHREARSPKQLKD